MANVMKVLDKVTLEALSVLHEKAAFIGSTDRQYDDQFKNSGGKIGSTLRVREPVEYEVTDGSVLSIQDTEETTQTLTVATRKHVAMQFTSQELVQSVNSADSFNAFSDRYIKPAVSKLISIVEADYIAFATKATANLVGSAGTALTDLTVPGLARAKLNQNLAPMDRRNVMLDSVTMSGLVNGLKGGFQDSTQIKEAMREGFYTRLAMADFYENERVWSMTNGSDVTADTDADALVTDGGNEIDMHTLLAVAQQKVGQVFTIAGVYDCHPETKQAYPHLKQFVITAVGATKTTIWPATILTGARKNVCSSTGADLAVTDFNAKTLTFVGSASTSYRQGLMYHKNAFQFISADLEQYTGEHHCSRKVVDGVSLRVWQAPDIINDRLITRMDILYGFGALRPQHACRLIGSANA
jgi:hypothetical protein